MRKNRFAAALTFVLAAALTLGPAAGAAAQSAPPARSTVEQRIEGLFLDLYADARARPQQYPGGGSGALPPMSGWTDLRAHARAWSDSMARDGYGSPVTPDANFRSKLCCGSDYAETVGAFTGAFHQWDNQRLQQRVEQVFSTYMDNRANRDNALNPDHDEFGIGVKVVSEDGNQRAFVTVYFRDADGSTAGKGSRYYTPSATPPPPSGGGGSSRPEVRGSDLACPPERLPQTRFRDLPAPRESAHAGNVVRAVECLVWWDVTQGKTSTSYDPRGTVTRGQMASFIANAIRESGGQLPSARSRFSDVQGGPHGANIAALASAGVIDGYPDGTFRPSERVTRGQMTKFLVEGFGYRSKALPAARGSWFRDVTRDNPHHANVNRAVEAGFAAGRDSRSFVPSGPVTRDQMALFLTRWLDRVVEDEGARLP